MRTWMITILMAVAGCGGGGDNRCMPGASVACACTNGRAGAQICGDDGRLGACSCDGPSGGGTGGGTGGSGDPTAPPPPTSVPGGPMLLSFSASSATLSGGDSVTFSAVVTHPSGLDALAGGTLTTPDGKGTYGPFDAGTQKGAFALRLSWSQIHQTSAIDFTTAETRLFKATFYDVAGRTATASVSVTLTCGGYPACNGGCINPAFDPPASCGVMYVQASQPASCASVCATKGLTCVAYCPFRNIGIGATGLLAGYARYFVQSGYEFLDSCSDVPPATQTNGDVTLPMDSMSCCCH